MTKGDIQVLKFGGTSIGSAEAIRNTTEIISKSTQRTIIIFSAFSGVTNLLSDISSFLLIGNIQKANRALEALIARHTNIIQDLFLNVGYKKQATQILHRYLSILQEQINMALLVDYDPKQTLALGELISSEIISFYFKEQDLNVAIINALDYMRINENDEPDQGEIAQLLGNLLNDCTSQFIITQGYICRNRNGKIDNLKRGGSDYSAAIIGVATNATTIQIWTDIDGLHNNDPRFVDHTTPITSLSFEEAAELAYFGAKVLHPQSILPAKEANIPVHLKNTFQPSKPGTLIKKQNFTEGIRAIAAKDGITSIKIKSYRMLMSFGFLKNVFEVFDQHKTSIDVITTSEVGVSLTIDDTQNIEKIVDQLSAFGEVTVEDQLSIVCIVGYFPSDQSGLGAKIMTAIKDIPIRMISFGGSLHNVSLIVKSVHKIDALNQLHSQVFDKNLSLLSV
jgi:aspartate kinase